MLNMKMNIILSLALFGICSLALAAQDKNVSFGQIKENRENYKDKIIQIEGKVKDLKMIKEGDKKFATFFLTEGDNPETTISVKVNLSKKKEVTNTFDCKDGEFTTVQGRFKSWGTASYLGKLEIKEAYDFKCSQNAQARQPAPVAVVKK